MNSPLVHQPDLISEISLKEFKWVFLKELKSNGVKLSANDEDKIWEAFEVWYQAHDGEERKDGDDYVMHTVRTALSVAKYTKNPSIVILALLHDVIENTRFNYDDIVDRFWKETADSVRRLSKQPLMNYI